MSDVAAVAHNNHRDKGQSAPPRSGNAQSDDPENVGFPAFRPESHRLGLEDLSDARVSEQPAR